MDIKELTQRTTQSMISIKERKRKGIYVGILIVILWIWIIYKVASNFYS